MIVNNSLAEKYREEGKEYYFLQPRSSMLGKSEEEIYKYFTTRDEMAEDSLPIMSAKAGTALHRLVQAQQFELGNISTAEKYVHNKDYNFTGHIDAISPTLGIGDIKTVSRNAFKNIQKNGPKKSHISQVNSYMATTGTHKGYIQYIMREDPTKQLIYDLKYDDALFQTDMDKLQRVQKKIRKQLESGQISFAQLRQGEHEKILAKEKAHEKLIEDTGKVDQLVDYFLYYQGKLDKTTGEAKKQKISYTKEFSNMAMNPLPEDNSFHGMAHGWFGMDREHNTAFGSPFRIGDFHNLTNTQISDMFEDQMGLDIETTGLRGKKGSVFQVAMGYSNTNYSTAFLKQPTNVLTDFLKNKSQIGKMNIDFTKTGPIKDYANMIPGFGNTRRVQARISTEEKVRNQLKSFFNVARTQGKNVIVSNANFEIDHLKYLMGNQADVQYSNKYISLRRELRNQARYDEGLFSINQINKDQLFNKDVARQKRLFEQIMTEAKSKKGNIIELQEISKTLNAVAQEKGLAPKTGRFAIGTNIEDLANVFLSQTEIHEGVSDVMQQNKIAANRTIHLIRDIETGKINKQNVGDLKGWKKDFFEMWNDEKKYKALLEKSMIKRIENELLSKGHLSDIDPSRNIRAISTKNINEYSIFQNAKKKIDPKFRSLLTGNAPTLNSIDGSNSTKMFRQGAAVAASLLVFAALRNAFRFSGRDDDANTIEGLKHGGWAGQARKLNTDFGSGFQGSRYHQKGADDPSDNQYMPLVYTGLSAIAVRSNWNKPFGNTQIDDLGYFGRLDPSLSNSQVLGRTQATFGDVFLSGIKRVESSLGGFPKSFGVSQLIASPSYASATYTIDITKKNSQSYRKYIEGETGRNLRKEKVHSVTFSKGKLYLQKQKYSELVKGKFDLVAIPFDLNQQQSMTQTSKSLARINGVNYIDPRTHSFLPVGGEGMMRSSSIKRLHAYIHESISKVVNLVGNPLEALTQLVPDANIAISKKIKKGMEGVPKILGLAAPESELLGGAHKVLGRHATRLGIAAGLLYFGFGTLDWTARRLAPSDTAIGDAGLLGAGAFSLRTAHQTYARLSDATGLTSMRDSIEEMSPGMSGWKASIGLTLSGAVTGAALAIGESLTREVSQAGSGAYNQFIANRKIEKAMPEPFAKIFKSEYTRVGRYSRMGGLMGAALSLPWLISGLGADESFGELQAEYEGVKEVGVRKGRYWEASMTPWEGGEIQYHRPGWYQRLMDDAKTAELYQGEDISPVGKLVRSLMDPYWLEKRRYRDQPYPYTGPDGSFLGMFAPLYEMTIGRALKAPAIMHTAELDIALEEDMGKYPVSAGLGGYGIDTITPMDPLALLRKQWSTSMEAMGLRGFAMGALKEMITGEKELGGYNPQLASAADLDSAVKQFHDLQLGGGILTTEAVRRILPKEEMGAVQRINPLRNQMPSWMPGKGYHLNFHRGDPFAKVKEGYYRLPGEGFATRHKDLKGIDPEDYPDIYKYKILSDVGFGSQQFKEIRGKLQNRVLTPAEMTIFNQVEENLKEKADSKSNFRDPSTYETILGRYAAVLTDIARSNPLEQLIPLSPAHKFLPGTDPISAYEETIYGKTFRRWSHPFEDFVLPALRQTANLVGMASTPEEQEYGRELEDYFDKIEYMKYKRLAEDAQVQGDQGSANMYMQQAEKTMSGLDPYMNEEELMKRLPQREQSFFKEFVNASENQKEIILEMSSPAMRDVYLAQWDKKALDQLESGTVEMEKSRRISMQQDIKTRVAQSRARRKAKIQDFSRSSQMPQEDWVGWDRRVDLEDVKMKYLVNEGRDYHYYGLWKDRMNVLSRKPYINAAAENVNFKPASHKSNYADAYKKAKEIGIINPRIAIQPGLEEGIDLEVQMDRSGERHTILRDLGYVI